MNSSLLKPTPWDTAAFGMPTWELVEYSKAALQQAVQTVGHHTVRVDLLADKRLLHAWGFYYCDTLLEPYCTETRLRRLHHPDACIEKNPDVAEVLKICHGAFVNGRFHRDFNLPKKAADLRYDNWLKQLLEAHQVYGLYWQGTLAGFIGYNSDSLVLHAISQQYRGRGISKYWWSAVCAELLAERNAEGNAEVKSSISAGNLAALNLYASLGFCFRAPKDVYHCLVE